MVGVNHCRPVWAEHCTHMHLSALHMHRECRLMQVTQKYHWTIRCVQKVNVTMYFVHLYVHVLYKCVGMYIHALTVLR